MSSVIDHEVVSLVEGAPDQRLLDVAQALNVYIEESTYTPSTHPDWYVITFKFMGMLCSISLWRDPTYGTYQCVAQCDDEKVMDATTLLNEVILVGVPADIAANLATNVFHAIRENYVLKELLKAIPDSIHVFGRIEAKRGNDTFWVNVEYRAKDGLLCGEEHIVPHSAEVSITKKGHMGEEDTVDSLKLYADLTSNFLADVAYWVNKTITKLPTTQAPTPEDFE